MVATRRGTRVGSPAKNPKEEYVGTPVSIRSTRRRTVIVTAQSQSEHTSDSQQDEAEEQNTVSAEPETTPKRETRGSKSRLTNKQPESSQEADISESESCCSVASDIQLPSRSKRRAPVRAKATAVDQQETSKTETPRRSMRGKKKTVPVLGSTTSQEDEHSEAESCSSVPSLSTRVTRSRRKFAIAPEDVTHSEAESCSSVVSGPRGSTVRRSTRSRVKATEPIPIHLEQRESAVASTALEPRRTRGHRDMKKSAEEDQAYESDGCQSGPSLSLGRTTRATSRVADSDSESISTAYTSLDSPCNTRGKETPCSSRTGSASSSCAVRGFRSRCARVKIDMLGMSLLIPKSVKKNEPKTNQVETTQDVPGFKKSDMEDVEEMQEDVEEMQEDVEEMQEDVEEMQEDVEEMQEEANNKTVITADQECFIANNDICDLTLTLDEDEVRITPESRQDISSEAEKDVEIANEIASSVLQVQAMGEESSSKPATKISDPAEREEDIKVLAELEEKIRATVMADTAADEDIITVDQGPSKKAVIKHTTNEERPSSSDVSKWSTGKMCISLLDSSEDEERDDDDDDDGDGLSVDGCNAEAGKLEIEDEMLCSGDLPGSSTAPHSHMGNSLFVIDTRPGCQPTDTYYIDKTQKEKDEQDSKAVMDEEDFVDEEGDDYEEEEDEDAKVLFITKKPSVNELSSSIDPGLRVKALGGLYINFDGSKSKCVSDNLKRLKAQKNQEELLKKSVIVPDFEKKDSVPPYKESKHAAKLKHREERAKTTGDGWFNMSAPELTQDLKNDLKALQMRSAMNPKRFYKKNDREGFPKYFQVGTVVDNPIDFYHSRIPKKARKRTIVEELLADAEFRSFNKRKYREVIAERAAAAAGKMNKKKHKFQKKQ